MGAIATRAAARTTSSFFISAWVRGSRRET